MSDASSTWALVVGTDVYGGGIRELSGAVRDAVAVVQWLRTLGVDDRRILLHAAPSKDSAADLASLNMEPKRCTQSDIGVSLRTLRENRGSQLFVFLMGHALFELVGEGVFLMEDADTDYLSNLGMNWLSGFLRGQKYTQQFIVLDGCLNAATRSPSLRPDFKPGDIDALGDAPALATVDQWFAYAASQGELAQETGNRGLFTKTLLEAIKLDDPADLCTSIDFVTGELLIDMKAAVEQVAGPLVRKANPKQNPGIRRLSMGAAPDLAIVARVTPPAVTTVRATVRPEEAAAALESFTLKSDYKSWARRAPEVPGDPVGLPVTTVLPSGEDVIATCRLRDTGGWLKPAAVELTVSGEKQDIVLTVERIPDQDVFEVTTVKGDSPVEGMTQAAVIAASRVLRSSGGSGFTTEDLKTGMLVRGPRGVDHGLDHLRDELTRVVDENTAADIRVRVARKAVVPLPDPPPVPMLRFVVDPQRAIELAGFAADDRTVRVGDDTYSLMELTRGPIRLEEPGGVVIDMFLPSGRWTTIAKVRPADEPISVDMPAVVGMPPLRNALLRPSVLSGFENKRSGLPAHTLVPLSDQKIRAQTTTWFTEDGIARGEVPIEEWTPMTVADRLVDDVEERPWRLPVALTTGEPAVGRLLCAVEISDEKSLFFPMFPLATAVECGHDPRIEQLSLVGNPAWDLLVCLGRLTEIDREATMKLVRHPNAALRLAAGYAALTNGFDDAVDGIVASTSPGPDAVILRAAIAAERDAVTADILDDLDSLGRVGDVPVFRWGVNIGRRVAQSLGVEVLAEHLGWIEDRLASLSTFTAWIGNRPA